MVMKMEFLISDKQSHLAGGVKQHSCQLSCLIPQTPLGELALSCLRQGNHLAKLSAGLSGHCWLSSKARAQLTATSACAKCSRSTLMLLGVWWSQ